jgi:hypothetical protein
MQKALQRESMDDQLRNRLWSALKLTVLDRWKAPYEYSYQDADSQKVDLLFRLIWLNYFKKAIDTLPHDHNERYSAVRDYFFRCEWWQGYDLIEFIIKNIPEEWKEPLVSFINGLLKQENADCRIVGDEVAPITDAGEIEAVESALDSGLRSVRHHLDRSLELLSDRKKPDYRNSIKESISAVEAICQAISGKEKATLPDCLKALKERKPMHPAFEQALIKLYSYTSDDGGIRHALSDDSSAPSYGDAKFMLVSGSAFINYALTKAAELGMKIKSR